MIMLLLLGMGKGKVAGSGSDDRDAYLHLCITILAAFCRVPDIAASADMVSKIPLVLEVLEKESASSYVEDCYEILFLTSTASENGVAILFESGGLNLLATQLPLLSDGSQVLELSLRIIQVIFSKISLDAIVSKHLSELSTVVVFVARQFGLMQNALKFDLLQLLCVILTSDHSAPLNKALRAMSNDNWSAYVRAGVVDILQNRVAPEQKIQALIVAEAMLDKLGEDWLIGQLDVPDLHNSFPLDRQVSQSARVEIAVLLNDLAYIKYEASSSKSETFPLKRRNLAIVYSLVENVIKLISKSSDDEGSVIGEGTFIKIISGLNETVEVVLEYLKDAKDHQQKKGDDLLASVRLVGSYLAETPLACKEKVKELLEYLLSVEGEDESGIEGVEVLASSGAYKAVSFFPYTPSVPK
ncbi:Neurochondrin [Bienertia sinuspersici]